MTAQTEVEKQGPAEGLTIRQIPEPSLGWTWIGAEEEELVLQVLRSKALFRYYGPDLENPPPMVATLEKEFREMIGTQYALAVTSGTAALETALGALGIGPGDEVIVPAWSWVSCFTSVIRLGGTPVLAEIDETLCLDPNEIPRLCTPRTKAVIAVHYQGVAADLDPILAEARKAGIAVLEDCAESPGALYKGKRIGSLGDIGIFSFQNQKSMTSGEGGMVVTNDPRLYERAVRMHDIGLYRAYHTEVLEPKGESFVGSQFRMSELTGAVALAQLRKLDRIRNHCRDLNARIMAKISALPGLRFRRIPDPQGESGFEIYFWLATPEVVKAFRQRLQAYEVPCQQMTSTYAQYRRPYVISGNTHAEGFSPFDRSAGWPAKGYRAEDFPRTEDLIGRFVAIPIGVLYTEEDAEYIAEVVCRAHAEVGIG